MISRKLFRGHHRFTTAATKAIHDVCIVGAGAVGCSIAKFLLDLDPSLSVCVVERDPSYKISSSVLSLGSIRQQFSEPTNVKISQFGIEFIRELSPDVQFDEGGYLFLAGHGEGARQLRENVDKQVSLGSPIRHFGGGSKLKEKYPWMNTDDIEESALGLSGEGWFDPYTLTMALKNTARQNGAVFVEGDIKAINEDATSIRFYDSQKKSMGEIVCSSVINAAGCWSRNVLTTVDGVDNTLANKILPVFPRKRNVFVVHCPDPVLQNPSVPLIVCPSGVYVRREGSPERGIFLCGGMESVASDDPDCVGDAAELVVDHNLWETAVWPAIAKRIPAFEVAKVQSSWCGFYDYNTYDQNGLIGKILPNIDNFYVATGFSGHGIQQAPAVGRGVAELVVYGEYRSLDLSELSATRVQEGRVVTEKNIV